MLTRRASPRRVICSIVARSMPSTLEIGMAVSANKPTTSLLMRSSSGAMLPAPVLQPRLTNEFVHLRQGPFMSEQMWWYSPNTMREWSSQPTRPIKSGMSGSRSSFYSGKSFSSSASLPTLSCPRGLPAAQLTMPVGLTTARASTAAAQATLETKCWPLPPSRLGEYRENWQIVPTRSGQLMRTQSTLSLLG